MVIAYDFCNRYFCIISCRQCHVCQIPLYTQFFLKQSLNWQPRHAKFRESLMLSLANNSLLFAWFNSFWTGWCIYYFFFMGVCNCRPPFSSVQIFVINWSSFLWTTIGMHFYRRPIAHHNNHDCCKSKSPKLCLQTWENFLGKYPNRAFPPTVEIIIVTSIPMSRRLGRDNKILKIGLPQGEIIQV